MPYSALSAVVAGATIQEAWGNQVKANFDAGPNGLATAAGQVFYATAAGVLVPLNIGTAGQVLRVNSGATAPEWGTPASASSLSAVLSGTTIALTPANGTWVDVLSLSVPAGTWIFMGQCTIDATNTTSSGFLFAQIFNSTDTASISEAEQYGALNGNMVTTITLFTEPVVLAATKTIKLRAAETSMSGSSPVVRGNVVSSGGGPPNQTGDNNRATRLVALKIA